MTSVAVLAAASALLGCETQPQASIPIHPDATMRDARTIIRACSAEANQSADTAMVGTHRYGARRRPGEPRRHRERRSRPAHRTELIEDGQSDERTMQFLGFIDAVGRPNDNRALSPGRARRAAAQLEQMVAAIQRDVGSFDARGFRELTPVGSNADDADRATDRHVELWIR